MKKLAYLGLSVLPGVVLSLSVISGCSGEQAPKPAEGPKMEAGKPATPPATAPKAEEKK